MSNSFYSGVCVMTEKEFKKTVNYFKKCPPPEGFNKKSGLILALLTRLYSDCMQQAKLKTGQGFEISIARDSSGKDCFIKLLGVVGDYDSFAVMFDQELFAKYFGYSSEELQDACNIFPNVVEQFDKLTICKSA